MSLNCRGLPSQAFEYIHYNGGLESEADYPYKAHNEKCQFDVSKVAATVTNVVNITQVRKISVGLSTINNTMHPQLASEKSLVFPLSLSKL